MLKIPPDEVLTLIVVKAAEVEAAARKAQRLGLTLTTSEELAKAIGDLEGARQMLEWSYDALVSYSWASSTMLDRYAITRDPLNN